jgi:hypothetical protein
MDNKPAESPAELAARTEKNRTVRAEKATAKAKAEAIERETHRLKKLELLESRKEEKRAAAAARAVAEAEADLERKKASGQLQSMAALSRASGGGGAGDTWATAADTYNERKAANVARQVAKNEARREAEAEDAWTKAIHARMDALNLSRSELGGRLKRVETDRERGINAQQSQWEEYSDLPRARRASGETALAGGGGGGGGGGGEGGAERAISKPETRLAKAESNLILAKQAESRARAVAFQSSSKEQEFLQAMSATNKAEKEVRDSKIAVEKYKRLEPAAMARRAEAEAALRAAAPPAPPGDAKWPKPGGGGGGGGGGRSPTQAEIDRAWADQAVARTYKDYRDAMAEYSKEGDKALLRYNAAKREHEKALAWQATFNRSNK